MNTLILKRFPLLLISLVCFITEGFSQNSSSQIDPDAFGYYIDALRYSQTRFGGTARMQGMAGAQTALGADMSTLAGNPAGLGSFRHSTFSITPSLGFGNTESDFCTSPNSCTTSNDTKSNFNISNIGIVFTNLSDDESPGTWRAATYGISFTRLNNFHNRFRYAGGNNTTSMTDYFVEIADGISINDFYDNQGNVILYEGLAYDIFLIDDTLVIEKYYPFTQADTIFQTEIIETTGSQNQWDLAYGANYEDKLYIGASIGIATIRYIEKKDYREEVISDTIEKLDYFTLNDFYKTKGTGINLKLGLIYRPSDLIRVGMSIQTPTYYSMTDNYKTDITAVFNSVSLPGGFILTKEEESLEGTFNYKLTTPYRLSGGIALFAGKKGFFSTDVEYVAYNSADLSGGDLTTFQGDNKTIKNLYKPAVNLKVGGEFRFEIFRVRAGFALYGDPYNNNNIDNVNRKKIYITGGVGMREKDYFLDIAFVTSKHNSAYTPYTLSDGSEPYATIKNSFTNLLFTFGTVF